MELAKPRAITAEDVRKMIKPIEWVDGKDETSRGYSKSDKIKFRVSKMHNSKITLWISISDESIDRRENIKSLKDAKVVAQTWLENHILTTLGLEERK